MEIGCFYSNIMDGVKEKGLTPDEALEIAYSYGIRAVDVGDSTIAKMGPEGLLNQLKAHGMHVSNVYGYGACDVCTEEGYQEALTHLKGSMDLAKAAESLHFMPVPQKVKGFETKDQEQFTAGVRRLLADLTVYGKEIGLEVIFENISVRNLAYGTFEEIDYILEHNSEIGFAYDSGNFPLVGIDELEAAKRYADRTVYVHLKDLKVVEQSNIVRDGVAYDSLDLGGGYLKLKEVLTYLQSKGYQGTAVIEINGTPNVFDRAMKSAEYLKSIL